MGVITLRADAIGSLLRPPELLEAQRQFAGASISQEQFKAIEDQAVDDAIGLQESVGLEVITDGEMRRQSFQSQMTAAISGFGEHDLDAFLWGDWHDESGGFSTPRPAHLGIVGRLQRRRYLSVEEFVHLQSRTKRIAKITVPSAGLWVNFWSQQNSTEAYATLDSFLADIVQILRDEVAELDRLGASYIQIDAPHYGLLLDRRTRGFYEKQGWSFEQWLSLGIELDNAVMAGFPRITFGFHI
jgi:5-methyltetrahydropteroyltriglutamate--homocysteine methyltransferase